LQPSPRAQKRAPVGPEPGLANSSVTCSASAQGGSDALGLGSVSAQVKAATAQVWKQNRHLVRSVLAIVYGANNDAGNWLARYLQSYHSDRLASFVGAMKDGHLAGDIKHHIPGLNIVGTDKQIGAKIVKD
jgi:hypothetical protein